MQQRAAILDALQKLPQAWVARAEEVFGFIGANALHGLGIGYVDVCLLASVRLSPGGVLWTLDKRMAAAAARLGVAAGLPH